ncbi:MAG: hypothetical protein RLZZ161_1086 [Bacteroidota bacterium]
MKKKRASTKIALFLCSVFSVTSLISQAVGPGKIEGGFGIDGDLAADTALHGAAAATTGKPSDDWFKWRNVKKPLNGLGVIDTTGAFYYRRVLQSSASARRNFVFTQPMSVPKLSRSNGTILLDGLYARDQADVDKTSITGPGGVKLIDDPSTWVIGSSSMGGKTDILEFASHMRRKGRTVKDSLFFYYGVAVFGTTGSKNITAELFVRDVRLDTVLGKLVNLGGQGGRSAWWLYPTGKVAAIGDLAVIMDYTGGVFTLKPQLWVRKSTYDSFRNGSGRLPVNFLFGNFYGQGTLPGSYGYAEILPKNGGSTLVGQGSANSINSIMNTPWGSASAGGYAWDSIYIANQFIEMSVNFTALGVDPALFDGINPCTTPYRTLMFYSQSSLAPTSSPKDFAGPYPFWRYPRVISKIKGTDTLNCTAKTGSIFADSAYGLAWYKWTTPNGNITGYNADSTVITFNKPGKYFLESAPLRGCFTLKDSVTILADTLKPVASIKYFDTLSTGTVYTIRMYGGNTVLSDSLLNSPLFGTSKGYTWNWTGPGGFTSIQQNPWISNPGIYRLRMTCQRNTCFDTTSSFIVLLPVEIRNFECKTGKDRVSIHWETSQDHYLKGYSIQRENNGNFKTIGFVPALQTSQTSQCYHFTDFNPLTGWNSYRLVLEMQSPENNLSVYCNSFYQASVMDREELQLLEHPLSGTLRFKVTGPTALQNIEVRITAVTGAEIRKQTFSAKSNTEWLEVSDIPAGFYTLTVSSNDNRWIKKIIVK